MIYIFHILVFFYTSHLATTGATNYQVIIISYGSRPISGKPSTYYIVHTMLWNQHCNCDL